MSVVQMLRAATVLLFASWLLILGSDGCGAAATAAAFHQQQQPPGGSVRPPDLLGPYAGSSFYGARRRRRRSNSQNFCFAVPEAPARRPPKGWAATVGCCSSVHTTSTNARRWPATHLVVLCNQHASTTSGEGGDRHEDENPKECHEEEPPIQMEETQTARTITPTPTTTTTTAMDICRAALLIAGTTVGGGFLALPVTIVVPLGGFPMAAASLSAVWLFLLGASHLLCANIGACFRQTHRDNLGLVFLVQHCVSLSGDCTSSESNLMENNKKQQQQSSCSLSWRKTLTLALLVLLTEATLVSQLARAGMLLADGVQQQHVMGSLLYYRLGCILTAAAAAWIVQNEPRATQTNAALTVVFLLACAGLFHAGHASAVWSRCGETTATVSVATLARAIPVQLQLLVYGEILPTVCHMLRYRPRAIGVALTLGSLLPLILLTGWAALGVALVPPSGAAVVDPVTVLLSSPGAVQSRLYILAMSAIGTTVLGCYLALQSAYRDVTLGLALESSQDEAGDGSTLLEQPQSKRRRRLFSFPTLSTKRWFQTLVVAGPPTAIACTSPALFERAIAFAGAYPVLLLYGVLPAGLTLLQAQRHTTKSTEKTTTTAKNNRSSDKNVLLAWTLGLLSLGMVGASAVTDVQNVAKWIVNAMLPK